jgi:thioredoxin-like negative regulator of GroEL
LRTTRLVEFAGLVDRPGLVLLDCWTPGCAGCGLFTGVFERVAARHPEHLWIGLDVRAEPALAVLLGVTSTPALVVFRDGRPLLRREGSWTETALERLLGELEAG